MNTNVSPLIQYSLSHKQKPKIHKMHGRVLDISYRVANMMETHDLIQSK